jgi:integrase
MGGKSKGRKKGKHPEKALSALGLKKLGPGFHLDGGGLYLQVSAKGDARSWILCTTINGKRCEIGLGGLRYVSLADARDKAIKIRKAAREGGNPLAERQAERRAVKRENELPNFEAAARLVHAEHSKTFRNPRHAAQWITTLETYAFPTIGSKRVDEIESDDILAILTPIWTSVPETASRVRQRLRTVFDWSIAKRYRTTNPTTAITKVLPKRNGHDKHFDAMPYTGVADFIHQLRSADAVVSGRLAFEFLILTAARTSEVLLAKWTEIDPKAKTWTIPASRMKAGRDHRVPLTARCIEILDAAKKITDGGEYVFPGQRTGLPLSNMVFHETLKRMNRKAGVTPHGFRSSFRDWAQEKTSHAHRTIESALAHVVGNKTEAAYLRTDSFEKRRELMTAWERFVTAKRSSTVVDFKKTR